MNNDKKVFPPTARDDKKYYRNIRSTYEIIIDKTGSKLKLPNNLGRTYCREFLENNYHCHYGKKYFFKHATFPKDFTPTEVTDINKLIKNAKDISLNPTSRLKPDNKRSVSNRRYTILAITKSYTLTLNNIPYLSFYRKTVIILIKITC